MREKDLVQELEEILEDHQPTSQPLINIIGDHNTVVIGGLRDDRDQTQDGTTDLEQLLERILKIESTIRKCPLKDRCRRDGASQSIGPNHRCAPRPGQVSQTHESSAPCAHPSRNRPICYPTPSLSQPQLRQLEHELDGLVVPGIPVLGQGLAHKLHRLPPPVHARHQAPHSRSRDRLHPVLGPQPVQQLGYRVPIRLDTRDQRIAHCRLEFVQRRSAGHRDLHGASGRPNIIRYFPIPQ